MSRAWAWSRSARSFMLCSPRRRAMRRMARRGLRESRPAPGSSLPRRRAPASSRAPWSGLRDDDDALTDPAAHAAPRRGAPTFPPRREWPAPRPRPRPGAGLPSRPDLCRREANPGHALNRNARRAEEVRAKNFRRRAGAERAPARRRARRFRRQGRDHQRAPRPGGRRSTSSSRRPASNRRALSALPTTSPARCRRSRRASPSCRAATPSASSCRTSAARPSICARCSPARTSRIQAPARHRARQDDRRRAGDRRSRQDAASAGRRHHRLRQVGGDQHRWSCRCSIGWSRSSAGSSWSIRRCWSFRSTTASRIC